MTDLKTAPHAHEVGEQTTGHRTRARAALAAATSSWSGLLGRGVATAARWGARARGRRLLHPDGATFAGTFTVAGSAPSCGIALWRGTAGHGRPGWQEP